MSDYIGIDYGRGVSNRDPETGIHYGVISQNTPSQYIWDDFEPVYAHGCPECGEEFDEDTKPILDEDGNEACPQCDYVPRDDDEWWGDSPIGHKYSSNDSLYGIEYAESLSCFYVVKSPFYTYAKYCSPCAPGALDLDSPIENGPKGYCLGEDFFEKDECPYPIYRLLDDELVYSPKEN